MKEEILLPAKLITNSMLVENKLRDIKNVEITILSPITLQMLILPVDLSVKISLIFGKISKVSPIANG